ncbi:hypothetical protein DFH29DRAFT_882942 [Suillus ampliporus]|nr:hypothetical protein DFH29DRAFT_882942 [Suillus ampliporus]
MGRKDVSKKQHPTCQNVANIPKPRKHSGLNPSLQPVEGQLNHVVEHTDTPMAYNDLLRSLDEASNSEMNDEYEGELELEDGPSNPYFGQPVPQSYLSQHFSGPDEDEAGLSNQYSGNQYYLPQCLSEPDEDEAGLSDQYYPPQCLSGLPLQQPKPDDQYNHQLQHSVPPQLQNYEQPLQHYQALPHYQLPQHHERQPMHFNNLPSSSPPPLMFNSTTDNYCQEDTPNNYYNHLLLHSFSDLTPPHIQDLQQSTPSALDTSQIQE